MLEQGVPPELKCEHEEEARHYLIWLGRQPVGSRRETSDGIKLERFAVRAPFRRRGAGGRLLQAVLADARPTGRPIYLHAQLGVARFYEQRGFVRAGREFSEAGIPHVKMLLAAGGRRCLDRRVTLRIADATGLG